MFGKKKLHHWNTFQLIFKLCISISIKKIISRIIEGIQYSRMSSKGFPLSHLPNLFHRGRNEHYYILRRDHKQNNQYKTWHMQRDPNIKAASSVFMAKHLEYFKMESLSPRQCWWKDLSRKSKCLSNRRCCWQLVLESDLEWPHGLWGLSTRLGKKEEWLVARWAQGQEVAVVQRGKTSEGLNFFFFKVMNYCHQEGNWVQIWNKSCGKQSKKLI